MLPEKFKLRMRRLLKDEYDDFIASYDEKPKKSFFINENKISEEDFLRVCEWNIQKKGFGYRLHDDVKVGKTPEHHSGMIYMQELSAMMPANFLPLNSSDWVLDMCASPGGKSIQVANRLKEGFLVSNEIIRNRAAILQDNIERMGLSNVCVVNNEPNELERFFEGVFDAVIVDAPCSGEGMFRKDQQAILNWSQAILESANSLLKQGGYLLYSTCTFSLEEDEMVVAEFCKKHNYKIIPLNHEGAVQGEKIEGVDTNNTLRFYPHRFEGEGQYVALLQKMDSSNYRIEQSNMLKSLSKCKTEFNLFDEFCRKNLQSGYEDIMQGAVINKGVIYYCKEKTLAQSGVRLINSGVILGEVVKNRFEPNHNFFTCFGKRWNKTQEIDSAEAERFLRGDVIECCQEGYIALEYNKVVIGFGKASQGKLKNHYPKKMRN